MYLNEESENQDTTRARADQEETVAEDDLRAFLIAQGALDKADTPQERLPQ